MAEINDFEATATCLAVSDALIFFVDAVVIFADASGSTTFATARAGERSPFFNGCTPASPSSSVLFFYTALLELSLGVGGTVLLELSLGVGGIGLDLVKCFLTNVRGGGR